MYRKFLLTYLTTIFVFIRNKNTCDTLFLKNYQMIQSCVSTRLVVVLMHKNFDIRFTKYLLNVSKLSHELWDISGNFVVLNTYAYYYAN